MMYMRVHNIIRAVFFQVMEDVPTVARHIFMFRARVYPGAKCSQFVIIGTFTPRMNEKVYLEVLQIHLTYNIHQPGFGPAPVHLSNDLQNPDRPAA
jgi:hypothetical protein